VKFEVTAKNFELSEGLLQKFDKTLNKLKHSLRSFAHFERQGSIIVEKSPRKEEFIARINFYLPKHHVATHDVGTSPEQALHNAAEDARDKVLKVKGLLKDIHEVRRKSRTKF